MATVSAKYVMENGRIFTWVRMHPKFTVRETLPRFQSDVSKTHHLVHLRSAQERQDRNLPTRDREWWLW
jgi:hypothetical protein